MLNYRIYLEDIVSMVSRVEQSLLNKSFVDFEKDYDLFDATLMRLHFIGETIKFVPFSLKRKYKEVRWNKYARLRNIISHKYSGINKKIIWQALETLPELRTQVEKILKELKLK